MSIIDVTGAWKVMLQDATAIIHWQYLTISNGDVYILYIKINYIAI